LWQKKKLPQILFSRIIGEGGVLGKTPLELGTNTTTCSRAKQEEDFLAIVTDDVLDFSAPTVR
jgi:hypothetical protein